MEEALEQLGVSAHSHTHSHVHAHHGSSHVVHQALATHRDGDAPNGSGAVVHPAELSASPEALASPMLSSSPTVVYTATHADAAPDAAVADAGAAVPAVAVAVASSPTDAASDGEQGHDHGQAHTDDSAERATSQARTTHLVDMYILLAGLSFHSFFVGLALGISNSLSLFLAIVAHQFFEGIALGARVARARLPKRAHIWLLDLVFSLAAPVGVAIGIGIAEALGSGSFTYLVVNGVFQALSGGILIYVAIIHLLSEEMERHSKVDRPGARNIAYLGLVLGWTIMAVIGIWA